MEKLGYPKRDILVKRVASAKDSQLEAKEEFRSALERYREVINFSGGDLEDKYNDLKSQLNSCESRAAEVRKRISSVAEVSTALFNEWQNELDTFSNQSLKRKSNDQLNRAQRQSHKLLAVMREAEARLEPALRPLRDNVLSLKHNLNARAISGLQSESRLIDEQVSELVRELERSVHEAEKYIESLSEAEEAEEEVK